MVKGAVSCNCEQPCGEPLFHVERVELLESFLKCLERNVLYVFLMGDDFRHDSIDSFFVFGVNGRKCKLISAERHFHKLHV